MSNSTLTHGAVSAPRPWSRLVGAAKPRVVNVPIHRGVKVLVPHEVELSQLTRYVAIAALAGLCALLWAWSRIDLRKTAVSLDLAERQYHAARADQARLKLELATLRDPARLERVGATLNLDREVPVVVVPAPIAPGTPAGEVAAR